MLRQFAALAALATAPIVATGPLLAGGVGPAPQVVLVSSQLPAEDDPGWDCRIHGDLECGPSNAQGVPAGLYDGGVLVAVWDPAWYGRPDLVPAL